MWSRGMISELIEAFVQTFLMMGIGLVNAIVFGGLLGTLLYTWRLGGLWQNKILYFSAGSVVNIVRSFPFVILLISIGPLTRAITGTSIGPLAASVPLSIAAIASFARLVEISLGNVSKGVLEAALAMGANTFQILWYVIWAESRPSLFLAVSTTAVSYLSYSAAAGIVGGGGVGDFAIRYGYYRFQIDVMIVTVILLVVMVQLIQFLGQFFARKFN